MVAGQLKLGADDGRLISVAAAQFERKDNQWQVKEGCP